MRNVGLISLSGEQLWPVLHCLANWKNEISHLFLLHTEEERRSIKPAETIRKFVNKWNPAIHVELSKNQDLPFSGSFLDVYHLVSSWIERHPQVDEWLINATSGTKIMLLGALQTIGIPKTRVIYRELSTNSWFEVLTQDSPGPQLTAPRSINIPSNLTDHFPVQDLVEAIWSDAGAFRVDFGDLPPPFDVVGVTKSSASFPTGWNFKEGFKLRGVPFSESNGQVFEKYIVGILREMGVTNLALSAKRNLESTATQEADIILNHKGRITILDLKLKGKSDDNTSEAKLFTQIRDADRIRQELGGLGAKSILLRPNQNFSEVCRNLADSYSIQYLDLHDTNQFIPKLAHLISGSMNEKLHQVQSIISDKIAKEPLSGTFPNTPLNKTFDDRTRESGILDIDSMIAKLINDLGQSWCFFKYETSVGIDFQLPDHWLKIPMSFERLSCKVHDYFNPLISHFARIDHVAPRNKRCRIHISPLIPSMNALPPLKELFKARVGGDLIPND